MSQNTLPIANQALMVYRDHWWLPSKEEELENSLKVIEEDLLLDAFAIWADVLNMRPPPLVDDSSEEDRLDNNEDDSDSESDSDSATDWWVGVLQQHGNDGSIKFFCNPGIPTINELISFFFFSFFLFSFFLFLFFFFSFFLKGYICSFSKGGQGWHPHQSNQVPLLFLLPFFLFFSIPRVKI